MKEPLLREMEAMVEDLCGQITARVQGSYAIYGHSMGALLAYLLTKRLLRSGRRPPLHLFLTGCRAPSVLREHKRHLLPRDEFLAELKTLGGSPDEILADPVMMDLFEPIIRADFQAIENYRYQPSEPLALPITVITGKQECISREDAEAWRIETTGKVRLLTLPGKHFFIYDHEQLLMRLIGEEIYNLQCAFY